MEVLLDEYQRLLADSAARLCGDLGGTRRLRSLRATSTPLDDAAWRAMAASGWIGLMIPEAQGGLALGMIELGLIQVEIGRHSVRVPLAAAAIAARALSTGNAAPALLGAVMSGETILLPAVHGAGTPFAPFGALPRAAVAGNGWMLRGTHMALPSASLAQLLLVAAEGEGGEPMLFVVRPEDARLRCNAAIDGSGLDDLLLDNTALDGAALVARGTAAGAAIHGMRAFLPVSVAFELLGLGEAAMALTSAQLKTREQFGRPIGSFQALQHRAVDCFITLELLRALSFRVTAAIDAGGGRPEMIAAVKEKAGRGVLDVVRRGVQLHGAMGYAEEHDIGLHYKRALTLSAHHGNEAYHLARFAALTHAEG